MKPVLLLFGWMPLVVCLFVSETFAAMPTQAFLRAGQHGQALLLERLGACYAVTPQHVIGDKLFATLVGGMPGAPQGDADLLQTFGYDLSILRTTGAASGQCGGSPTAVPALAKLLSAVTAGIVSSVNPDGSVTRRNVTINDVGLVYIRIRPRGPEDQLFKGLSGSLVLANERPIGILMTVDAATGEGRALRYDRAIETLRPFFDLPNEVPPETLPAAGPSVGTAGRMGRVISWNSPPLGPTYRTGNLIDAEGEATVWYAQADVFPIEVIIELPGDEAQVVNSLRLVGKGVEPKTRLPRDFEILVSSGGNGGWIPVSSGTYFQQDADRLIHFMPMRTRRIMLRIYSHWGDREAVGLSGMVIPARD